MFVYLVRKPIKCPKSIYSQLVSGRDSWRLSVDLSCSVEMDREVVKLEVAFVNFKPQMGLKTSVEVEEVIEMNEEELNKREAQFNSDKYLIGPPSFNHFIWVCNKK